MQRESLKDEKSQNRDSCNLQPPSNGFKPIGNHLVINIDSDDDDDVADNTKMMPADQNKVNDDDEDELIQVRN